MWSWPLFADFDAEREAPALSACATLAYIPSSEKKSCPLSSMIIKAGNAFTSIR